MAQEKSFENKIKEFLKTSGCWFVKYWAGAEFTKSGVPDILCCCGGYFLGIEVKAPKGKASELQKYNLKKIDEAGGFGVLLYPKDYGKFITMVNCMTKGETEAFLTIYSDLKGVWDNGKI